MAEATRVLPGSGRPVRFLRVYRLTTRCAGTAQTKEFAQDVVRVGSSAGNDVVLADDAVSRIHCEIVSESAGFRLRDLGSTNGTTVDGYRTNDIYLRPGSRIRLGHTEITFEPLSAEAEMPLSSAERFGPIVGRSIAMRELFAVLERVAQTDATVLVEAESGCGKELIAEALHTQSRRAAGPFVVFDCASVPDNLLESQLFGHERGAFTGADSRRAGSMEEADGGTLFLDEIGELPLDLQPKLLRAIEQREVRRVGSTRSQRVSVRIVAATNRNVAQEVNRGSFRDDLYYRLAVVRLRVPPLREHADDVPILVEHFLRQILSDNPARFEAILSGVSAEQWSKLQSYPWPGNVRELRNVIERGLAMAGSEAAVEIDPTDVGPLGGQRLAVPADEWSPPVDTSRPFLQQREALLARFEEKYLTTLFDLHKGRVSKAAVAAGIDRAYFTRLLRKYR